MRKLTILLSSIVFLKWDFWQLITILLIVIDLVGYSSSLWVYYAYIFLENYSCLFSNLFSQICWQYVFMFRKIFLNFLHISKVFIIMSLLFILIFVHAYFLLPFLSPVWPPVCLFYQSLTIPAFVCNSFNSLSI